MNDGRTFDAVARPRGLVVAESGFFAREEPIAGLGVAPAASEQAFTLKEGEVSPVIRTPQGFAFITVTGRQDAYLPKLDEVKARVPIWKHERYADGDAGWLHPDEGAPGGSASTGRKGGSPAG